MAPQLVISEKMARNHPATIITKLRPNDRMQAAVYAPDAGLVLLPAGGSGRAGSQV